MIIIVALIAWYELEAHPLGSTGQAEVVTVTNGEPTASIVSSLANHGVVSSTLAYRLYLLLHGSPTIEPGSYLVHQNTSFGAVTGVLSNPPNVGLVTVPAGFTLAEIAQRVGQVPGHDASAFLAATKTVHSPWEPAGSTNLEGLVGTGTYQVLPDEPDAQLVQDMVTRFNRQATAAGATPAAAAALGVTPYQLVTVASIVQKEGYLPKNMPQVARVIYNRLEAGMPLQMDSTVLYSEGRDGGPVSAQDEQDNTPYNTYLHTGLTPTPICVPSSAALHAAADPPAGQWLFFVVVNKDGTEAFSDTYAQQLANEALAKTRGLG